MNTVGTGKGETGGRERRRKIEGRGSALQAESVVWGI